MGFSEQAILYYTYSRAVKKFLHFSKALQKTFNKLENHIRVGTMNQEESRFHPKPTGNKEGCHVIWQ
jgi:hypothetical protein